MGGPAAGSRQQADQFTKSLRAILADLKRIRCVVMESKSLGDRLEAFFAEFLEELLLKDFAAILTFNHPYRFRDEIVDPARRIAYTPAAMQVIAEEYLSSGISTDLETARRDAEGDLLTIESMFAQPILKVIEISKTSSEALDMLFAIPWQHSKPSSRTGFLTVRGLPEFLRF
jgi:Family of unknown function (DUF5716)